MSLELLVPKIVPFLTLEIKVAGEIAFKLRNTTVIIVIRNNTVKIEPLSIDGHYY